MSLMKYAVLELTCDYCGFGDRVDAYLTASRAKYIKEMRAQGWKISRDYRDCICPECRKEKRGGG